MSGSQLGHDLLVIQKIFPQKHNGYFIELGAHDGIKLSNTLLLEKNYGWNGICIEPNPILFNSLKNNRSCSVSNELAFSEEGLDVNFSLCDLLGGITDQIDTYHSVKNSEQITLKTVTLTSILDKVNAPTYIEYMSLDTEGSEFEILKGLNLSKYHIQFMSIEHNYVEPKRTLIRNYLYERGYALHSVVKHDDNYIFTGVVQTYAPRLKWNYHSKKAFIH